MTNAPCCQKHNAGSIHHRSTNEQPAAMDETIFYIVIFLIYLVFQVLGNKKKKKKQAVSGTAKPLPDATSRPAPTPSAEPTMEDALREIRQALGMGAPAKPAPPPPQAKPLPLPRPAPRPKTQTHPVRSHGPNLAETAPKKSWSSEFKAYATHYADSDFEELATEGDRFGESRTQKTSPRPATKTPPAKKNIPEPTRPISTSVSRSRVMNRLKNPHAAREAFILSEILGPPRVQKRR